MHVFFALDKPPIGFRIASGMNVLSTPLTLAHLSLRMAIRLTAPV